MQRSRSRSFSVGKLNYYIFTHTGSEPDDPTQGENEMRRPGTPRREWITRITSHDVRIENVLYGDSQPNLGLYYRCEWRDPDENELGRTWENEYVFGKDSDMLLDYCKRHHKAIFASIKKSREHNKDLDMDMEPTFYLTLAMSQINAAKRKQSSQHDDVDEELSATDEFDDPNAESEPHVPAKHYDERTKEELDQMYADAGGEQIPRPSSKQKARTKRKADDIVEPPPMRTQAVDSVTIKCGDSTKIFDVDEDGLMLKDVDALGKDMGITADADMLLFAGRYLADRQDGCFLICQNIINAECPLTLTGKAVDGAVDEGVEIAPEMKTAFTAPFPDETKNTYILPNREVHPKRTQYP